MHRRFDGPRNHVLGSGDRSFSERPGVIAGKAGTQEDSMDSALYVML